MVTYSSYQASLNLIILNICTIFLIIAQEIISTCPLDKLNLLEDISFCAFEIRPDVANILVIGDFLEISLYWKLLLNMVVLFSRKIFRNFETAPVVFDIIAFNSFELLLIRLFRKKVKGQLKYSIFKIEKWNIFKDIFHCYKWMTNIHTESIAILTFIGIVHLYKKDVFVFKVFSFFV